MLGVSPASMSDLSTMTAPATALSRNPAFVISAWLIESIMERPYSKQSRESSARSASTLR